MLTKHLIKNGSTFTLAATTWALYNNSRETALNNYDHLNTTSALLGERLNPAMIGIGVI